MSGFSEAQRAALRAIARLWPSRPFVLVGASAIGCQLPMPRTTADLDLTVAASLDEFPAGLDRLPGWTRHPTREHEWTGPAAVRLDVIPAGPDLLAQGSIEWPSGHRMNLTGLRHAFVHALEMPVGEGLAVKVAELPVIALLKMVAYLDRPRERRHDLEDLAFLIEESIDADDPRRWSEPVVEAQLSFEVAAAFVLGIDIGSFATATDTAVIDTFAAAARANHFGTVTEIARAAPTSWRHDEDEALARIEALLAGVRAAATR